MARPSSVESTILADIAGERVVAVLIAANPTHRGVKAEGIPSTKRLPHLGCR
jgi:hypothetical protein